MMAQLLEDSSFCEEFIQQCPAAVEVLNLVAQECSPGENTQWHMKSFEDPKLLKYMDGFSLYLNTLLAAVSDIVMSSCAGERLSMVEAQCERVRMLYRDCARPPPPPLQTDRRQVRVQICNIVFVFITIIFAVIDHKHK